MLFFGGLLGLTLLFWERVSALAFGLLALDTSALLGRLFHEEIDAGDYRSKAAFTFAHVLQTLAESGHGQPTPVVTIPTQ